MSAAVDFYVEGIHRPRPPLPPLPPRPSVSPSPAVRRLAIAGSSATAVAAAPAARIAPTPIAVDAATPRRLAPVTFLASTSAVSGAGAGATGRARPDLRLTTRGRVVSALLVVALGGGLLGLASASRGAGGGSPRAVGHSRTASVTVAAGDTLWSVAVAVAPTRDPRNTVADLRRINRLQSAFLTPGQVLQLP